MATVVITSFLFALFHVCKMDAECKEKRREWGLQPSKILKRQDRFSMDQQRFDEILAEITTGYNNIRSSFDNVNIAEILEEMVTEYARAALEAESAPKFAELAVLLQHCAMLYGRKVDYLYRHVLDVSEALASAAPPPAPAAPQQDASPGGARRRRRGSGACAAFAHIALSACGGCVRAREAPRPPPTLPRLYLELEPRAPAAHRRALTDHAGEPLGLPQDYHAASRLLHGFLVEELEAGEEGGQRALRPLSLLELQRALSAAAPPDPPPAPSPPPAEPLSPAPPLEPPPEATPPPVAAPLARRKRRSDVNLADIVTSPIKGFITEEVLSWARQPREFRVAGGWVRSVVQRRARRLLAARRRLQPPVRRAFRGFEDCLAQPGGFAGWSRAEALEAEAVAAGATLRASDLESDDDGFFEGSSFSSRDSWGTPPPPPPPPPPAPAAWGARVAAAAVAQEARGGVDVRALAAAVLAALRPAAAVPFSRVLAAAAAEPHDVSRLLLATLFLANSGNVELSEARAGDFSVQLLSTDESLYAAAAAAEAELLAPPAPAQPAPAAAPPALAPAPPAPAPAHPAPAPAHPAPAPAPPAPAPAPPRPPA